MTQPAEARISVVRDGTSWLCAVEWPDGQIVQREMEFALAGYPEIVVTSEEKALECLELSVRNDPGKWRQ